MQFYKPPSGKNLNWTEKIIPKCIDDKESIIVKRLQETTIQHTAQTHAQHRTLPVSLRRQAEVCSGHSF